MKKPKHMYFVYQFGELDFVGMNLKSAKEMSVSPGNDRTPYKIERWKLVAGKYCFDCKVNNAK